MAAAQRAQKLLENVANRKRNKQMELGGLVITEAKYGNLKHVKRSDQSGGVTESASQVIDVTLPLNFLVTDSGQLKVCYSYLLPSLCAMYFLSCQILQRYCSLT